MHSSNELPSYTFVSVCPLDEELLCQVVADVVVSALARAETPKDKTQTHQNERSKGGES